LKLYGSRQSPYGTDCPAPARLDGRNRLPACEAAGVEPRFEDFEGDDAGALALVISLNVQRRDMTAGQRAIVAARALPPYEKAAKERQTLGKVHAEGRRATG
jgi:hypothetical protein